VTIKDHLKKAFENVTGAAKDELAAREEKSESDIAPDPHVAGSRAGGDGEGEGGEDGEDGPYVGRTTPQFDAEVEQSGAEARSEQSRRAK
jgi:hypothetical protein